MYFGTKEKVECEEKGKSNCWKEEVEENESTLLLTTDSVYSDHEKDDDDTDAESTASSDFASAIFSLNSTIASLRRGNPLGSVGKASCSSSSTFRSSTCKSIISRERQHQQRIVFETRNDSQRSLDQIQEQDDDEKRDSHISSLNCINESISGLIDCTCLIGQTTDGNETFLSNFVNFEEVCNKLDTSNIFPVNLFWVESIQQVYANLFKNKLENEIGNLMEQSSDVSRYISSRLEKIIAMVRAKESHSKARVLCNRSTVVRSRKFQRIDQLNECMGKPLASSFVKKAQYSEDHRYIILKTRSEEMDVQRKIQNYEDDMDEECHYDSEPDDLGRKNKDRGLLLADVENDDNNNSMSQRFDYEEFVSFTPKESCDLTNQESLHPDDEDTDDWFHFEKKGKCFDRRRTKLSKRFLMKNDHFVTCFIQEVASGYFNMIWHPANGRNNFIPPTLVKVWCEVGSDLDDTIIYPKFMWRTNFQPKNETSSKIRGLNRTVESVELLNIGRVISPLSIDRTIFPYASPRKSLIIHTCTGEKFLFEAANEEERNHIANGIKLTVARLVSKVMLGDETVFEEFFSPFGGTVNFLVGKNFHNVESTSKSSNEKHQLFNGFIKTN